MLKQRTHARNRVNKGPTRMTILSYLPPGKENELKILRDLLPWKKSRVENSVTLNEVNDKLQLNVTKRNVSITFEQQEIVHIRTFYDYSGEIVISFFLQLLLSWYLPFFKNVCLKTLSRTSWFSQAKSFKLYYWSCKYDDDDDDNGDNNNNNNNNKGVHSPISWCDDDDRWAQYTESE